MMTPLRIVVNQQIIALRINRRLAPAVYRCAMIVQDLKLTACAMITGDDMTEAVALRGCE
jgi:hypothetical protein